MIDNLWDDDEVNDCTCHYVGQGGSDPEAYYQRDRWCPIHGDAAHEAFKQSYKGEIE